MLFALLVLAATPPAPPGMVHIVGGAHTRGHENATRADEKPRVDVVVSGFFIDEALVSVDDFAVFVDATQHRTSGERLGFGYVAILGMKDWEWKQAPAAWWRRPFGALIEFENRGDLPVTQVSWVDADAYCRWKKKRLPREVEWEVAMGAGSRARYPWGDAPRREDGKYGLNHWQGAETGEEHSKNFLDDGFLYLSPVRAFPPNKNGVYDPVGNVWQLTNDWYDAYEFAKEAARVAIGEVVKVPLGPATGTRRITRGGSWWCSARTCHGFGLWYRGKNDVDAAFNNVGFRCVISE